MVYICAQILFLISVLATFTACQTSETSKVPGLTGASIFRITSPLEGSSYGTSQAGTVPLAGTCNIDGQELTITVGTYSSTTTCAGGQFSKTLNLLSLAENTYSLKVESSDRVDTVDITVDHTGPFPVSFSSPSQAASLFGTSFPVAWTSIGNLRSTNTYQVEAYANGTCLGPPFSSWLQNATTYTFTPLAPGTTYSLKVYAFDQNDTQGTGSCTPAITVDTTAPTLSISDPNTASTSYARQVVANVSLGSPPSAKYWCLSTTVTTPPLASDSCFQMAKPTTYSFTNLQGLKTLYVWTKDLLGNVLPTVVTDTITLDTILPATPTVVVSNPVGGSTTTTDSATNNLAITLDTGATAWCVIELAAASPAPVAPLFNNACWVGVRPISVVLSARGSRKVYVYTKDLAENVSLAAGSASISYASNLDVTGPAGVNQSQCSGLMTVSLYDSLGALQTATAPTTLSLSDGTGGTFYSDLGCVTLINSVTIGAGSSSTTFYYRSTSTGAKTITATGLGTSDTLAVTVTPIYQVSPGLNGTSCAIVKGFAECWGNNSGTYFGASRPDSSVSVAIPVTNQGAQTMTLGTGYDHACSAVSGAAYCWGQNTYGQIGNGSYSPAGNPTAVSGLSAGVMNISAGYYHSCAVVRGAAKCWGINTFGQLGNSGTTNSNTPVSVTGLTTGVTKIVAHNGYSCAIVNGGAKCWGYNGDGQLGNGNNTDQTSPVDVTGLTSNVTDIALGDHHACAIQSGAVYCWGDNLKGQLGDGNAPVDSNVPVTVAGMTSVTSLATGLYHTCAINAGYLNCWGDNSRGQFGVSTATGTPRTTPFDTTQGQWVKIWANNYTTCMLDNTSTIYCIGSNGNNEGGDGSKVPVLVPTPIMDLATNVSKVSAGNTSCAVLTDNTLACWGKTDEGQAFTTSSELPVSNGFASVSDVSTGSRSTCAVNSGAAYCWGSNADYRLGTNAIATTTFTPTAQAVTSLGAGVTKVHVSAHGKHACAIMSGAAYCWGDNSYGQLGGTPATAWTPALALSSGSFSVIKVVAGYQHSCALVQDNVTPTDRDVYCWGRNNLGQVGDSTLINRGMAQKIIDSDGVSNVVTDLSTGGDYSCAVVDSALKCWGNSSVFQEAGFTGTKSAPFLHPALTTSVTAVSSGPEHTCVIKSSGRVYCFGKNLDGRLGDLTLTDSPSPVKVVGLTNVTQISAGDTHTCGVEAGQAKCWGNNLYDVIHESFGAEDLLDPTLVVHVGKPARLSLYDNVGTHTAHAGQCAVFTINMRDINGPLISTTSNYKIFVTTSGTGNGDVQFYASADCSGGAVNHVFMNNTNTVQFSMLAPTAQEIGLQATGVTPLYRGSLKFTVTP